MIDPDHFAWLFFRTVAAAITGIALTAIAADVLMHLALWPF